MIPQRVVHLCILALFSSTMTVRALADVPPERGKKRVPMRYQVTEIPKGDMHMWAVPCGEGPSVDKSNKWFEIKEGAPNSISRFAAGDCDVFAITHEKFVSRLTSREESGPNWVADAKAVSVRCEGLTGLYYQTELPDTDPRKYADVAFRVQALDATQCKLAPLTPLTPAPAPGTDAQNGKSVGASPGKSRCGCGLTRKSDAFAPAVLAIAALAIARRKRATRKAR